MELLYEWIWGIVLASTDELERWSFMGEPKGLGDRFKERLPIK